MFKLMKKKGNRVRAFRLGTDHPLLRQLTAEGTLVPLPDGTFEVYSQEARKGGTGRGELARAGDYIKLDSSGAPYPNAAVYFQQNHRHLAGDDYEQIPRVLAGWNAAEPMCPEIEFLIRKKGLVLDPEHPGRYYTAPLWGTTEVADRNAVLVFYSISYGADGAVEDASFNLVAGDEFEKTYSRC